MTEPDREGTAAADQDAIGGVEPAEVVRTGHPPVDGTVQALANAADLPLGEQIAEYEAAHRTLQETLHSIDDET